MEPALQDARYISLTTFRKDGRPVATPVWVAPLRGKLYFYTSTKTGKAKRIRATGKVKVAPSDIRGKPMGNWSEGSGRIVTEPNLAQEVNQAIARKYGFQHYVMRLLSWLSRRDHERVAIELTV